MTNGADPQTKQVLLERADGTRRWVNITLVRDGAIGDTGQGTLEGLIRDITDSKRAEAMRRVLDENVNL